MSLEAKICICFGEIRGLSDVEAQSRGPKIKDSIVSRARAIPVHGHKPQLSSIIDTSQNDWFVQIYEVNELSRDRYRIVEFYLAFISLDGDIGD